MDPTPIIERELVVLDEVLAVLDAERDALRQLDYARIDLAAEAKLELDARLAALQSERAGASAQLTDDLKTRYREKTAQVRAQVDENNRRLQVTAKTVEALVRSLTGTQKNGYGRRGYQNGPARAVLTSTIG